MSLCVVCAYVQSHLSNYKYILRENWKWFDILDSNKHACPCLEYDIPCQVYSKILVCRWHRMSAGCQDRYQPLQCIYLYNEFYSSNWYQVVYCRHKRKLEIIIKTDETLGTVPLYREPSLRSSGQGWGTMEYVTGTWTRAGNRLYFTAPVTWQRRWADKKRKKTTTGARAAGDTWDGPVSDGASHQNQIIVLAKHETTSGDRFSLRRLSEGGGAAGAVSRSMKQKLRSSELSRQWPAF